MNDQLAMVAWCDPDGRRFRLSWSGITVGALIVTRQRLTYVMGAEEVFTLPLPGANLDWRKSTRMFASRFDIHLPDGKFRFYLSPPGNDAPRPDPVVLQTISDALEERSGIALAHGPSGMVSDNLVTNVLDLRDALAQLRAGNRNEEILRAFISEC
ncbi:hypothetical protein FE633_28860 [Streptomyces montanus]|uniref:Uncharacterized protein n=1 Tax=Streptomyces montanus TaxID=2580423 RepID=A0A5R9FQK1_9ACTN|nr:hypothetical protein [Streptomyces montanus]TLS42834.1 hypothetical protein FE633_28860 [Streptomyces montanus]